MAAKKRGRLAAWEDARKAETWYSARLRQVAVQAAAIVEGLAPRGAVRNLGRVLRALDAYADALEPWAEGVAEYMVQEVGRRNDRIWREVSKQVGASLRAELAGSRHGLVMRERLEAQVPLIRSIPLEAGQRVRRLTEEGLLGGRRPESVAQEILRTSAVSKSRARLIARTETSRTAQELMRARAESAGSRGYVWRTSKDADVRDTHRKMEGVYVPWDDPPKTDPGLDPYHAGCGPNCRCFSEPVLPDL